jgi:hypothetical protein
MARTTDKEKLEKAGWKFIAQKRGGAGTVTHLYEDPETGQLHSQQEALKIFHDRKFKEQHARD